MAHFMKVNLSMGKNEDLEFINGIMIDTMKESGKMINKMDMEFIMIKIKSLKDIGKMGKLRIEILIILK